MIELKRKRMWVGPFSEFVEELRRKPFEWNKNDCLLSFVGRVVEVLTGQDFHSKFAGTYHDSDSAYDVMVAQGFDNLADLVGSYLPEYAHPSESQIGDIAAIKMNTRFGYGLGIINGERVLVLTENGIGSLDRRHVDRAFRVG